MGLEDEPLIPHTEEELYKKVRTQHTDTVWKFAYFFMLAACGAGGYFAFINRHASRMTIAVDSKLSAARSHSEMTI